MKKLLLGLSILISSTIVGQVKIEQMEYKEDSVNIYPLILKRWESQSEAIPFMLDSLPSGRYVYLQEGYRNTRNVIADFYITEGRINGWVTMLNNGRKQIYHYEKGMKNGKAFFYNYKGKLLKEVNYVDGIRTGEVVEYYTVLPESLGERLVVESISYEKVDEETGDWNTFGPYKSYYKNGPIYMTVEHLEGEIANRYRYSRYDYSSSEDEKKKLDPYVSFAMSDWLCKPTTFWNGATGREGKRTGKFFNQYSPSQVKLKNCLGKVKTYYPNGAICLDADVTEDTIIVNKLLYSNGNEIFRINKFKKDSIDLVEIFYLSEKGDTAKWELLEEDSIQPGDIGDGLIAKSYESDYYEEEILKYSFHERFSNRYYAIYPEMEASGIKPYNVNTYDNKKDTSTWFVNEDSTLHEKEFGDYDYHITMNTQGETVLKTKDGRVTFSFLKNKNKVEEESGYGDFMREQICGESDQRYSSGRFNQFFSFPDSMVIKLDGELFTGGIVLKKFKKNKPFVRKVKDNVIYLNSLNKLLRKVHIPIENGVFHGDIVYKGTRRSSKKKTYTRSYVHGDISKKTTYHKKRKHIVFEKYFKDGIEHGIEKSWEQSSHTLYLTRNGLTMSPRWNERVIGKKKIKVFGLDYVEHYKDGKLVGVKKIWDNRDYVWVNRDSIYELKDKEIRFPYHLTDTLGSDGLAKLMHYDEGKLEGWYYALEDNWIDNQTMWVNDTVNGQHISFFGESVDTSQTYFYKDGKRQGRFIDFFVGDEFNVIGEYDKGNPVGIWKYKGKKGQIKAILEIDSVVPKDSYVRHPYWLEDKMFKIELLSKVNLTGNVSYFHANEAKMTSGRMEQGIRVNEWLFYSDDKKLIEKHQYDKQDTTKVDSIAADSIATDTINAIETVGSYQTFNKEQEITSSGRLIGGEFVFDCTSDLNLTIHDRTFDLFIDLKGDTLVKNGEGYIKDVDESEVLRAEGKIENGVKVGKWIYYTPLGNANEVGFYIDGLKDGVWLSGDLKGVHYENPDCYVVNNYEDETREDLDFEFTIYKMGKTILHQKTQTFRDKPVELIED